MVRESGTGCPSRWSWHRKAKRWATSAWSFGKEGEPWEGFIGSTPSTSTRTIGAGGWPLNSSLRRRSRPWRWVGPLAVNSDRLDLGITALSRWPLKEGEAAARSFPVVVDVVLVTTDPKQVPPEKFGDDTRGLEIAFEPPLK